MKRLSRSCSMRLPQSNESGTYSLRASFATIRWFCATISCLRRARSAGVPARLPVRTSVSLHRQQSIDSCACEGRRTSDDADCGEVAVSRFAVRVGREVLFRSQDVSKARE